jgi:lysophospholipase L1-like esterase
MAPKWKIALILSILGNLSIVYVAYKALDYRSHVNYFLEKYKYVVEEFSGRKTYAEDNRRLMKKENSGKRVVFIGSQITQGWDLDRYFPDFEAVNRGVSGQRLAGYLLRFRPDVIELAPRAVVVELSSYNFRPENTLEELMDYLLCIVDLARQNKIEPFLTTIIPVRSDFDADIEEPYMVQDSLNLFNQWLKSVSQENGIELLDFSAQLADSAGFLVPEYSEGQITLSPLGYEKISSLARNRLSEFIK